MFCFVCLFVCLFVLFCFVLFCFVFIYLEKKNYQYIKKNEFILINIFFFLPQMEIIFYWDFDMDFDLDFFFVCFFVYS